MSPTIQAGAEVSGTGGLRAVCPAWGGCVGTALKRSQGDGTSPDGLWHPSNRAELGTHLSKTARLLPSVSVAIKDE